MSEQGWRDFLDADGLEDWVVLHGGPTAVYSTTSLRHSIQIADAVAELPGLDESAVHLSFVSKRVTIRLTREVWKIEKAHIAIAREISKVAQSLGAKAEPGQVQEVQLAIAAKPGAIDLPFWRAVLGYEPMLDDNAVDPLGLSSPVWMQDLDESKPLQHAMHIDVSVSQEHIHERLEAALNAGGVMIDDTHAPAYWILADRSGNKVCIVAWPDGAKEPESIK